MKAWRGKKALCRDLEAELRRFQLQGTREPLTVIKQENDVITC